VVLLSLQGGTIASVPSSYGAYLGQGFVNLRASTALEAGMSCRLIIRSSGCDPSFSSREVRPAPDLCLLREAGGYDDAL